MELDKTSNTDLLIDGCKEHIIINNFTNLINKFEDKDRRKYKEFYENGKKMINNINEWGTYTLIKCITNILKNETIRGQREYSYKFLNYIAKNNKEKMKYYIA